MQRTENSPTCWSAEDIAGEAKVAKSIREQKADLLFEYLRKKLELDHQHRLLCVSEELAAINHEHERALNEVFLKEAKQLK